MDINPSSLANRSSKVSPNKIHAIPFTLLPRPNALRAQSDGSSLITVDSYPSSPFASPVQPLSVLILEGTFQGAHVQECRRVLYTPSDPRIDDRMEIQFCQYPRNFKLLPPTEKVRTFCYPTYF